MFKKTVFGIGILIVLALEAVPFQETHHVRFTPAFGILLGNDSFHNEILWTLGLSADFFLTEKWALTPEFYFASQEVGFKIICFNPA